MRVILGLLIISGLILIAYPEFRDGTNNAVLSDFSQFEANANRTLGAGALDRIPNYDGGTLRFTDLMKGLEDQRSSNFPAYLGLVILVLSTLGLVVEFKRSKKKT